MRWTHVLLVAFAIGHATSLRAQDDTPPGDAVVERGDELHALMRPLAAYDVYQEALTRDSTHYAALWRSAREAVNLGMLTGDEEARDEWYRTAVGHARRAVEADSTGSDGLVWLAISLGRQALHEGARTRVRLADEMRGIALRALEADSMSASAHHVLGEWNAEIERLGGLSRFAARTLLGADTFDEASWDDAEMHLRRAVELDPRGLIHRLALARVFLDRDRPDEARSQLREVLELPAVEPTDALHKQEAQELLRDLG